MYEVIQSSYKGDLHREFIDTDVLYIFKYLFFFFFLIVSIDNKYLHEIYNIYI